MSCGLYQFFELMSFSIWMSSAWSATIFFNWPFSRSSSFSRRSWLGSSPPYLLFTVVLFHLRVVYIPPGIPIQTTSAGGGQVKRTCYGVSQLAHPRGLNTLPSGNRSQGG